MTAETRVSIVIPARNEGEQIRTVLDRIFESVRLPCEVLVVVDREDDTTIPVITDRSNFCSRRCTRYSGRPSLIVIAVWPSAKLLLL